MQNEHMLQSLVSERLRKQNLSLRQAGRESNVSHVTIARILNGGTIDYETFTKVSKWLGVRPSAIMDNTLTEDSLAKSIAALVETNVPLRNVFEKSITQFKGGQISKAAMDDILAYVAFRLGMESNGEKE